jgi:cytidylate kinase
MTAHYDDVLADIHARDARDSGRKSAPLKRADDAIVLDTSALTLEQAIEEALRQVDERLARVEP